MTNKDEQQELLDFIKEVSKEAATGYGLKGAAPALFPIIAAFQYFIFCQALGLSNEDIDALLEDCKEDFLQQPQAIIEDGVIHRIH